MMHPKQVINTKRGHTCTTSTDQNGACACGPVSKRPASNNNGGEGGGEESLADSLFSLVTVAEQQRQAQERGDTYTATHWNPLACSAPPALSSRQSIFPLAERLIAFTTASREYPHLRPVPLQDLASLKLFSAWVRRSFELKDDCHFVLFDRSVEAKKNSEEESGLIDSDMKLLRAKDIEIVEVPREEADRIQEKEQDTNNSNNNSNNNSLVQQPQQNPQNHQELLLYAKSILIFLSEKGNGEARSIINSCPSSFVACTPLSLPSESHHPSLYPSLHSSTGALVVPSTATAVIPPPALPRIVAQAPPCLIPGYYIFSPVFDSYGEKRKLPIKIEIPRALVFNGERYKTVSTYIGLGPFGNDPNSFVKLEGDHLVGTVASRLEDDEEGANVPSANGGAPVCTYVFKNLRLKTRSLIRTVLDVSYNGMRTGRFFFMVDNEVLPNTSRRFEIKAPSGYTIKMVNKTARSNPVAKHAHTSSPPSSQPSSPQLSSRPPSPPESPHPLSHSQPLPPVPSITLPQRPHTPPAALQSQTPSSPSTPPSFHQLQLPPSVLMQMKQKQANQDATPPSSPALSRTPTQSQTQLYQQLQSFLSYAPQSQNSSKSSKSNSSSLVSSGTLSPPTMPKGFPNAALAPPPAHQLHTQTQQAQQQQQQTQQQECPSESNSRFSPHHATPSLVPFHRPIITSSI